MLVENDVRLIRQRLAALDEGRLEDAQKFWQYLTVSRGLNLQDVLREDLNRDWLAYWGVPGSPKRMTLLMDYGKEPVFRIPATYDVSPPPIGTFEQPGEVPAGLESAVRFEGAYVPPVVETAKPSIWDSLKRFLLG